MIRRPSKFLREIWAQMVVDFGTESVEGARQDTPPLPSTTSLQEDPSPQLYRGRSEGWSTTDEEKPQLSSRSPSPDYTVGTRGRSTRRSKPSVARPLLGSPHSKSHPIISLVVSLLKVVTAWGSYVVKCRWDQRFQYFYFVSIKEKY